MELYKRKKEIKDIQTLHVTRNPINPRCDGVVSLLVGLGVEKSSTKKISEATITNTIYEIQSSIYWNWVSTTFLFAKENTIEILMRA